MGRFRLCRTFQRTWRALVGRERRPGNRTSPKNGFPPYRLQAWPFYSAGNSEES